ncbi:5-methyltetrahydropteroyltriglutamate--homocysteine methyltransferase [Arcanobacterium wilhelmae]|uniref:5-methyltetrahydropteroyltriglutamate--homocysteine methyltransferase n=1 Tax=Arcanobacterium wilhelmae TaxID=1803177 RepID=A0ABT9NEC8_9ACTO|nr:cobalamin-independent methionine synthase II family protein [Arcanobacterium wilhelmae]MDP9801546.1 5-methyltetrahydropteroyltriglutamate--homocysteine methyltransferase [Arcanobacterium wilhelmae]WFN90873.1 cobalamin-independent methionine synthase II family protein [Arcanobacterium wilhelmae]
MTDHILTTHVGSLPRTPALLEANQRRAAGEISDADFREILELAVGEVVARQREIGLDIINEGEYGHITSGAVDYGAWWNYSFSRLGGLTLSGKDRWANDDAVRSEPGKIRLTSFQDRRDRRRFNDAYTDPTSGILTHRASVPNPEITGPITYVGHKETRTDVGLLTNALAAHGGGNGFIASLSPGAAARLTNKFYDDEVAQLCAFADAQHDEYKIITDAGFTVQLDAPDLAEAWDQINPEPSVEDFQAWLQLRIDAANRALEGINPDQVRLHICWGSWHGPHTTDIPFEAIVDQCLQVNAKYFSFEASSPRHAHEWRVWGGGRLPKGRVLVPGVVSHSTNVVEHPRLVADRIVKFAELVGPENVIASTDCGLGGRIHRDIAWAKLESLVEGAHIASTELFG